MSHLSHSPLGGETNGTTLALCRVGHRLMANVALLKSASPFSSAVAAGSMTAEILYSPPHLGGYKPADSAGPSFALRAAGSMTAKFLHTHGLATVSFRFNLRRFP